eukprot:12884353-Prorocentrum_lima.AAC.1
MYPMGNIADEAVDYLTATHSGLNTLDRELFYAHQRGYDNLLLNDLPFTKDELMVSRQLLQENLRLT